MPIANQSTWKELTLSKVSFENLKLSVEVEGNSINDHVSPFVQTVLAVVIIGLIFFLLLNPAAMAQLGISLS
jgi:hypothetical protein